MAAADNYTAALAERLGDFVDPAVQWQRSLWSVGVLLALRELNEASEGVQAGALSSKAVKWLAESIRKRLPGEPGVGCEQQRKALDQLLTRDLTAGGVNHRELGFWITDVETHYLARWANAVSLECRPSRELAARALASHLVDSGLSSRRLRSWLRGLLDCGTALDAPALVDAAAALLAQGLDTYKVMVLFERPPRKPTAPPEEWRDASAVSTWLSERGFEPRRQHGGLLLSIEARDSSGAAEQAADIIDRLVSRSSVTRHKLQFSPDACVEGEITAVRLVRARRAEVRALEREDKLLVMASGGPIDAAIELVSHLNTAPAPVAVAGGWSAIETLLFGPGDTDKVSTADRMGYLVACSWPRAELTTLAWARRRQTGDSPDALAEELDSYQTNRERADRILQAVVTGENLHLTGGVEGLALRRMQGLVGAPRNTLLAVQHHAAESLRRLYRQRNLVLHGGKTSGVALTASLRTAAPLVGAGLDRLTHAYLTRGTDPLELAARARMEVERAGTGNAPALTALLE